MGGGSVSPLGGEAEAEAPQSVRPPGAGNVPKRCPQSRQEGRLEKCEQRHRR
jgi:hypothetical protein